MTITNTAAKQRFNCNGVTTDFAIPFAYQANSEIKVYERDDTASPPTLTLLTLTTDYTLVGSPATTVRMNSAPASTSKIIILRSTAKTQSTDYAQNDGFPADSHEDALDKLTQLVQELIEKTDRALALSLDKSSSDFDPTLPTDAADNPGATIAVNQAGNGLEWGATTDDIADAADNAAAAAASATAAATSASSASTSASTASTAATNASNSAAAAATSETNAASSASAASTSETNAANSATAASGSATTASTQATNADTSATNAATSETNASNSATAAATSATNAANSATAAATSATNAATSETNASASATAAAASAATASNVLSAQYAKIVGSASQVTAGVATHSTVGSAITAASDGDAILILPGTTHTETVSCAKRLTFHGLGYGSYVDGAWTFASGAGYASMRGLRLSGSVTINSGVTGIIAKEIWFDGSSTFVDNSGSTIANILEAIQG